MQELADRRGIQAQHRGVKPNLRNRLPKFCLKEDAPRTGRPRSSCSLAVPCRDILKRFLRILAAQTNFNRNMLTVVSDAGLEKVRLVAGRCSPEFNLTPEFHRFVAGAPEARQMAPYVLVGVDDIPSRWQVQRCTQGILIVSGTSHFSISASCHGPGEPCCGCQHPVDDPDGPTAIPTVSFISFWAGLAMAVRLIRRVVGASYSLDRQHLWLTPLRMDQPHAAVWSPVAPRKDCPVQCLAVSELVSSGAFASPPR